MKKIKFRQIIKIVNILLGVALVANFAYFGLIVFKGIKTGSKQKIDLTAQRNPEIENLILELEKNSDKIKEIIR
jgi:hypothetical protein